MLIDSSYFAEGSRHIMNVALGKPGVLPDRAAIQVKQAIESYIAELQYGFLEGMLGKTLGARLHEYICQDSEYALIRRVDAYLYRGVDDETVRGEAIAKEGNEGYDRIARMLCEPFADYVFFHILRDSDTQATVTGLVRLKCANDYVSPLRRQVNVWNTMVDKNRRFVEWVSANRLTGIDTSCNLLTKINQFNL